MKTISNDRILYCRGFVARGGWRFGEVSWPSHELCTFFRFKLSPKGLLPQQRLFLIRRRWESLGIGIKPLCSNWGDIFDSVFWMEEFSGEWVDSSLSTCLDHLVRVKQDLKTLQESDSRWDRFLTSVGQRGNPSSLGCPPFPTLWGPKVSMNSSSSST